METNVYHVVSRGNNKADVFHSAADREAYLELLRVFAREEGCTLHHYALMTNHVHLILAASAKARSRLMKRLNYSYSMHHKKRYGTEGHVWKNRYGRFLIVDDNYLLTCGIYTALNPVRAGIVASPEDYKWSSFGALIAGKNDGLTTPDPAFLGLGETDEARVKAYLSLAEMWLKNPVSKKAAKKFFSMKAPVLHPSFLVLEKAAKTV